MRQPNPAERQLLRALATQVRQIAEDPSMSQRRDLWKKHNDLQSERPMILCFPEGSWSELLPDDQMRCEDQTLRRFERQLRQTIYWWQHIHDDAAIDPFFNIGWHVQISDYGVEIPRVWGDNRGSYVWDPPIKDLERDFPRLKPRRCTVDRDATYRALELADSIFGDVLPPRIRGHFWWTVGLTQTLVFLIGLEQMMIAMYDQPEALHRIMAFLRDDMMNMLDWTEREGLLTARNAADYVGSGGLAYTDALPGAADPIGQQGVALSDVWGFAESQETVGISPQMFADFVMPYQQPMLERFGLNCYGCCEGLEHRIDVVKQSVPRLRRVSVSPKADQAVLAEKLGRGYIFSRKADPVPVCVDFNEQAVREDLRRTLDLAGDLPLEIILKDTHTVQQEPSRIRRWVQIAQQEVENYMGAKA